MSGVKCKLMVIWAKLILASWAMLAVQFVVAQTTVAYDSLAASTKCPFIRIEAERLPDLNIPRAAHKALMAGGEYVVFGGHTNGFVPTPTAEYFENGKWHMMQMTYNHDFGTALLLKSGKVLLVGGVAENIGVGHTYTAELYDPQSHTFDGFGSMGIKRAKASALELDSGRVVVSGNWYHDDGIELFDGKMSFSYIKDVSLPRSYPLILRIAKDDALIIGSRNHKDEKIPPIADRLKGGTVRIPLLETWHPFIGIDLLSNESFIGDEEKGVYSYLIPVEDEGGQVAIMKVENGQFSLLPTVCPIPMQSELGGIWYFTNIVADCQRQRAYLIGINSDLRTSHDAGYRYYVLAIDYAQRGRNRQRNSQSQHRGRGAPVDAQLPGLRQGFAQRCREDAAARKHQAGTEGNAGTRQLIHIYTLCDLANKMRLQSRRRQLDDYAGWRWTQGKLQQGRSGL